MKPIKTLLNVALITLPLAASAQSGTWVEQAPMPTARYGPATGVIGGKLYVASGAVVVNAYPYPRFTNLEVYDPVSNSWTSNTPIPIGIYGAGVGVIGGKLYVAGGAASQTDGNNIATLQVYDPVGDIWTNGASLPAGGSGMGGGVINGKLYVAGGADAPNTGLNTTLRVYDPVANSWSTLYSPLPTARNFPGVGVVNGILYVVGGFDLSGTVLSVVEAYNPANDTWTTKASMPTARYQFAVEVVDGILYAVGGNTNGPNGILNTVEAYNPVSDTWITATPMPTARTLPGVGVINGVLYVTGGLTAVPFALLATNEAYTPSTIFAINLYAGLTISGSVGATNRIDYRTDLSGKNWTALTNVVLPTSPYLFIDATTAATARRFYRAVLLP
jgi:N-acetylneuraminic acid mutarotase